ncbi:MAG: hypothetical protein ACK559_37870, partial [bacterium]
DRVAREDEGAQAQAELGRGGHGGGEVGVGGLAGAARVAEDRVREAVAAHLLPGLDEVLHEAAGVPGRMFGLGALGHPLPPGRAAPGVPRRDHARVQALGPRAGAAEDELPHGGPGGADPEPGVRGD